MEDVRAVAVDQDAGVIVAVVAATAWMVSGSWGLWGVILAVALYPTFAWLRRLLGGRGRLAAALLTYRLLLMRRAGQRNMDAMCGDSCSWAMTAGLPDWRRELEYQADWGHARVAAPLRDEFALFRPIRIHPILEDELREITAGYREIVVVEANDGQYADLVELAIHREVKRVPLLGGRISLEAVREGIDRVLGGGPSEPPIPAEPTEKHRPSPLGVSGA